MTYSTVHTNTVSLKKEHFLHAVSTPNIDLTKTFAHDVSSNMSTRKSGFTSAIFFNHSEHAPQGAIGFRSAGTCTLGPIIARRELGLYGVPDRTRVADDKTATGPPEVSIRLPLLPLALALVFLLLLLLLLLLRLKLLSP